MKILHKICIVICVALLSTSCASALQKKVSIESCDNINVMGFSGVKADIGFRNESGHKIKLRGVRATVKKDDSDIGTLSLKDQIVIPRRTELYETSTLWRLSDVNALAALSASKSILGGKYDNFKVDLEVEVKVGPIKRTVRRENIALTRLIKSFN